MFKQRWRSLTLKNPEGKNSSNNQTRFGKIFSQLFKRKPLRDIITQTNEGELARLLNFFALNTLGLGAIIGAGIFTMVGFAAKNFAGPAEIVSLLIGTFSAFLAALSYAEMASMIPASGSSYTYVYTVMGEFCAWLVGWDLCLEYTCAAAVVGASWANYVGSFIELVFSVSIDHRLFTAPVKWNVTTNSFYVTESWICLPAALIILFLTAIIVIDIGASSIFNSIIVTAKILILIIFICVGIKYIDPKNYHPFLPSNKGGNTYGAMGLLHATSISFFAFIGFDAITTATQEATPEAAKRLPLSLLTSLGIASVLYLGMASVMLGVVKYNHLNGTNPIEDVCNVIDLKWLEILVYLAAIFGLTSVILVNLYGQSRVFYSMSKDGLLIPAFSKTKSFLKRKPTVNNTNFSTSITAATTTVVSIMNGVETTVTIDAEIQEANKPVGIPVWASIVTGGFCAVAASFLPIDFLAEFTSIGTLFAFIMVHLSVIIMHWTHTPQNDVENSSDISDQSQIQALEYINTRFRFPSRTLICPILGILMCLLLIGSTTQWTIIRFVIWNIVIGQPIYWLYSRKHSLLGNQSQANLDAIDPTNACENDLTQKRQPRDVSTRTIITQTIIDNRATCSVRSAETIEQIIITRF